MLDCSQTGFNDLVSKEWIVTNGSGAYASSTITGLNTSRYHGLLIASFNPPLDRKILVSKVEETVVIDDKTYQLSSNEYPDTIYPQGFGHLTNFILDPFPRFVFKVGTIEIHKSVFMLRHSNTTVVQYTNKNSTAYTVRLNPLYVYRDFHKIENERSDHKYKVKKMGQLHQIEAFEGAEKLFFKYSSGTFVDGRCWNKNILFRNDRSRGNEHIEDLFSTGYLEYFLKGGESIYLVFSTDPKVCSENPKDHLEKEKKRLQNICEPAGEDQFLKDLLISGDQFLVKRVSTDSTSVIAGYHWFGDWGRDSMIAIRGLCIACGRKEEARSVIGTFLSYVKNGLIPNRFPDYPGEELEYNTADATLWLFVALYEYHLAYGDKEFVQEVLPILKDIIEQHTKGTLHNIYQLPNGLLHSGNEKIQITWMDAKLGDTVFTPRNGCAVEINALWYNALKIYDHFRSLYKLKPEYEKLAVHVEKSFREKFWNENGYLLDVVSDTGKDESNRPNQIFALSLPYPLLETEEEKKVLKNIEERLLTPYGLRTLSTDHPDFKAKYEGNWFERDQAYHQGTVWPFLLPEYLLAFLRIHKHSTDAKNHIQQFLIPLKKHFYEDNCIHGISEVFDGLEPDHGKGCVQQAWSVSNLLLLLLNKNFKELNHID